VIAQQVLDDKGKITLRKWNPEQESADLLDDAKAELMKESETGWFKRVLFGCLGKETQSVIDYVEDDVVNLDNYLDQIRKEVWDNKVYLRLFSVSMIALAFINLLASQKLNAYVEQIPSWTPMQAQFDFLAPFPMGLLLSFVMYFTLTTLIWIRTRPVYSVMAFGVAGLAAYALNLSSF
jgi:hypothetical protein